MAFVGNDSGEKITKVKPGDCVVLKRGSSKIIAAGIVVKRGDSGCCGVEGKEWLRDFDGWDLPAYCYVDWHRPEKEISVPGLRQGTIYRIDHDRPKKVARRLLENEPICLPRKEPAPTAPLSTKQIEDFVIAESHRPIVAEELSRAVGRIGGLAKYYRQEIHWKKWEDVREHETRTFLIVPLLLALGWTEQQIKIELPAPWTRRTTKNGRSKKIDIACFKRPYASGATDSAEDQACVLILESKGLAFGLDYAHKQGKRYAKHFPECNVVVTSNGYCYKAYKRRDDGEGFDEEPTAYLNLLRPRDRYPLDPQNVDGGLALLKYLLPPG
jgi:hypothetical protein